MKKTISYILSCSLLLSSTNLTWASDLANTFISQPLNEHKYEDLTSETITIPTTPVEQVEEEIEVEIETEEDDTTPEVDMSLIIPQYSTQQTEDTTNTNNNIDTTLTERMEKYIEYFQNLFEEYLEILQSQKEEINENPLGEQFSNYHSDIQESLIQLKDILESKDLGITFDEILEIITIERLDELQEQITQAEILLAENSDLINTLFSRDEDGNYIDNSDLVDQLRVAHNIVDRNFLSSLAEMLDRFDYTTEDYEYLTLGVNTSFTIYGYIDALLNGGITAVGDTRLSKARATITLSSSYFPDANFRSALASALGIKENASFDPATVTTLGTASNNSSNPFYNRNITNLKGVEYFTNLTAIYLQYNSNLKDLTPLSNLQKLTTIYAHNCYIESAYPTNLPNLKTLNIANNWLILRGPNIATEYPSLTNLDISYCRFTSFPHELASSTLTTLNISQTLISWYDLDHFKLFPKLSVLTIGGTSGSTYVSNTDLSFLYNLSLTDLTIYEMPHLTSVNGLTSSRLNTIKIEDCTKLQDFGAIGMLSNLTDVSIINCGIERLYDFSYLRELTSLTVHSNSKLTDLTIYSVPKLQILDAHNCNVDNIYGLDGLTSLTELHIYGNPIDVWTYQYLPRTEMVLYSQPGHDLSSYASFLIYYKFPTKTVVNTTWTTSDPYIKTYTEYIPDTYIALNSDYFPDSNLRNALASSLGINENAYFDPYNVYTLYLNSKNISNIRGLDYFVNLSTLYVTNNPSLTDLTPLSNLTSLQYLYANNCDIIYLPKNLTYLSAIEINNNPNLMDLTPLSNLQNLRELFAQHCNITKLPENLSDVSYFHVTDNPNLVDISALATYLSIYEIGLADCGIIDLSPLQNLGKDSYILDLFIQNNPIDPDTYKYLPSADYSNGYGIHTTAGVDLSKYTPHLSFLSGNEKRTDWVNDVSSGSYGTVNGSTYWSSAIYSRAVPKTTTPIFISDVTLASKTYDGTTNITVSSVSFTDGSDSITLTKGTDYTATATLDNKNAGTRTATVTVTLLNTADYELEETTFKKSVTVAKAKLGLTKSYWYEKQYDGNDAANFQKMDFSGLASGDTLVYNTDFTITNAKYQSPNVGSHKITYTFTLNNTTLANNYYVSTSSSSTTGTSTVTWTITPAPLTISDITVTDKTYDGNTSATVSDVTFSGLVPEEELTINTDFNVSASFDSADAGNNKTVTATVKLNTTTVASNYTLSADTKTKSAVIEPLPITINTITAEDKEYDKTTTATITDITLNTTTPDNLTLANFNYTATFDNYNAGDDKTVTTNLTLNNTNYTITNPTLQTTANITKKVIDENNINYTNNSTKVYDGTTDVPEFSLEFTNLLSDDEITSDQHSFTTHLLDKNVGERDLTLEITLNHPNYTFINNDTLTITKSNAVNITKAPLVLRFVANSKTYDGTDEAEVSNITIEGLVKEEELEKDVDYTLSDPIFTEYIPGEQQVTMEVQLENTELANNYTITSEPTTASIHKANATFNISYPSEVAYGEDFVVTLTPVLTPMQKLLTSRMGMPEGTVEITNNENETLGTITENADTFTLTLSTTELQDLLTVGENEFTISLSNHTLFLNKQENITIDITPVVIDYSIQNPTVTKQYDGKDTIPVSLQVDNPIGDDMLTLDYQPSKLRNSSLNTIQLSSADVSTHTIELETEDLVLSGEYSQFYTLQGTVPQQIQIEITPNVITIVDLQDQSKVYDGTTEVTEQVTYNIDGKLSEDVLTIEITSHYESDIPAEDINIVHTARIINDTNHVLSTEEYITHGTITKAPLEVNITYADKTYDGTTDAIISSIAYDGLVDKHQTLLKSRSYNNFIEFTQYPQYEDANAGTSNTITTDIQMSESYDPLYELTENHIETAGVILQAEPVLNMEYKTSYTYGEVVNIQVTPTLSRSRLAKTILGEDKVEVSLGDNVLSSVTADVSNGGTLQFNTADLNPGLNVLTISYGGSRNYFPKEEVINITLDPLVLQYNVEYETSREYNGTSLWDITLKPTNVINSDAITLVYNTTNQIETNLLNVGDGTSNERTQLNSQQITPNAVLDETLVSIIGDRSEYYTIDTNNKFTGYSGGHYLTGLSIVPNVIGIGSAETVSKIFDNTVYAPSPSTYTITNQKTQEVLPIQLNGNFDDPNVGVSKNVTLTPTLNNNNYAFDKSTYNSLGNILKADTTLDNSDFVNNIANTLVTMPSVATYGDTVSIQVEPKTVTELKSTDTPIFTENDRVQLIYQNSIIAEGEYNTETKVFTMKYDTTKRDLPVGRNKVTIRFTGNDNLNYSDYDTYLTINPKEIEATFNLEYAYDNVSNKTVDLIFADTQAIKDNLTGKADITLLGTLNAVSAPTYNVNKVTLEDTFYTVSTNSVTGTITINKSSYVKDNLDTLTTIPTLGILNNLEKTYTLNITDYLPTLSNLQYGTIEYLNLEQNLLSDKEVYIKSITQNSNLITIKSNKVDSQIEEAIGQIVIPVQTENFETFNIIVPITSTNREIPVVKITSYNDTLTYGDSLDLLNIDYQAITIQNEKVDGNLTIEQTSLNTGTHQVKYTFTPNKIEEYEEVTGYLTVKVNRATTTTSTLPTISDTIKANQPLEDYVFDNSSMDEEIQSLVGEEILNIEWIQNTDTTVKPGQEYSFIITTENYIIQGTITILPTEEQPYTLPDNSVVMPDGSLIIPTSPNTEIEISEEDGNVIIKGEAIIQSPTNEEIIISKDENDNLVATLPNGTILPVDTENGFEVNTDSNIVTPEDYYFVNSENNLVIYPSGGELDSSNSLEYNTTENSLTLPNGTVIKYPNSNDTNNDLTIEDISNNFQVEDLYTRDEDGNISLNVSQDSIINLQPSNINIEFNGDSEVVLDKETLSPIEINTDKSISITIYENNSNIIIDTIIIEAEKIYIDENGFIIIENGTIGSIKYEQATITVENGVIVIDGIIIEEQQTSSNNTSTNGSSSGGSAKLPMSTTNTNNNSINSSTNTSTGTSSITTSTPSSFSDTSAHWGNTAIDFAYSIGLISGYTDGTFKPDNSITRAEISVIFTNLIKYLNKYQTTASSTVFPDVDTSSYYTDAVKYLASQGIITGYEDGTFKPNNLITREEVVVLFNKLLQQGIIDNTKSSNVPTYNDVNTVSWWAQEAFENVNQIGLFTGDNLGNFNPQNNITRAEVAQLIYKLLNK